MSIKGLLGRKVGMTQTFLDNGDCLGVTVIEVGPCVVTQVKTEKTDGYNAVQLGFDSAKEKSLNKPKLGRFKKHKLEAKRFVREVEWDGEDEPKIGDEFTCDLFEGVQYVNIVGRTKGRGFAGVVKRWNFRGGAATHGQSDRERAPGSLGRQGSNPGDVIKNKKMAGHYGDERLTSKNLELVSIMKNENVILVHGSVPGPNGGYVIVKPSIKRRAEVTGAASKKKK